MPWDLGMGLPQVGPPDPAAALGARMPLGTAAAVCREPSLQPGLWTVYRISISEKKEHLLSTYNQEKNRAVGRHYAVSPGRMNHGLPPLPCILSFLKGSKSSLMRGMVSPCP